MTPELRLTVLGLAIMALQVITLGLLLGLRGTVKKNHIELRGQLSGVHADVVKQP